MQNLKLTKKFISICLLSTSITLSSLSGCAKKMDCDIKTEHAHKYVSEEGYFMYKNSEYETQDDMTWTDETISLNSEITTLDKFNLLKIEDNIDTLEKEISKNSPYTEYQYSYPYTTYIRAGKNLIPISNTGYAYTTNKNHDKKLTGKARNVSYKYKAYKIIITEDGTPKIEASELVDDITIIKDEYPYFKLSNYKEKVYSDSYELDKITEKNK